MTPCITLENETVSAGFSSETGAWIRCIDKRTGEDLVCRGAAGIPSELAQPDGRPADGTLIDHAVGRSSRGPSLVMTIAAGGWRCVVEYALAENAPILSRRFTIENAGGSPATLRGATYSLPAISVGPHTAAVFPGSLPVGDRPIQQINRDTPLRAKSLDGLCYLWSSRAGRALGAYLHSEDELAQVSVTRTEDAGVIAHRQDVLAPLQPGQRAVLGTQYVWLASGGRDDALRSVHAIYDLIGLAPPAHALSRLRERTIYCAHPGGVPEKKFSGYGGFKAIEAYVPTLKRLGVDTLWLLPIFEHGDGTQWNLYSPFDHFKISPLYGTIEELESLVRTLQREGIDLVFDLVPHGPPADTPLGREHPDWECLTEEGTPHFEWNQLAFDYAHPEWQNYMADAAEYHAREYGVCGARIDVAFDCPSNWDPKSPHRPTHSKVGGGLGMTGAIRNGFLRARTDTFILPEEYFGANVFYRHADLTYDSQLFYLFVRLEAEKAAPEVWAEDLSRFLHDQALTLPRGALKMRFIGNHDTVSWTVQKKRPRDAYGPDRARALTALCGLVDGVPMIYQGQEDPAIYGGRGESNIDCFERIFRVRRTVPALTIGKADFLGARATEGVFACVRGSGRSAVIVLISFNPCAVTSRVTLPPELQPTDPWRDRLEGERFEGGDVLEIPMPPHGMKVLFSSAHQGRPISA